jgi:hypothetical protein
VLLFLFLFALLLFFFSFTIKKDRKCLEKDHQEAKEKGKHQGEGASERITESFWL